ncbi:hypothetical protein P171DRAFT_520156 [Karstenula rhodostoma CBS 690.94]|uniref:Uncharacterized protein n=1 Tax=Karstenula rhodostoma CBS 690.94 TaxID=1392251 RepID=A0A9P4PHW4_9PLEO|nr:hypothetical protein P171DRAFT_520156 [Karstenula rhodostoma CBS 690.94]
MAGNGPGNSSASSEQAGKEEEKRVVLTPEEARSTMENVGLGDQDDCVKCGHTYKDPAHKRNHVHCRGRCILCDTQDHPDTLCPVMRQPEYAAIFTKEWREQHLGMDDFPPEKSENRGSQSAKAKGTPGAPKNAPVGPRAATPAPRGGGFGRGRGFGPPPAGRGGYGGYDAQPYGYGPNPHPHGYGYGPPPGAYGPGAYAPGGYGGYGPGFSGDLPRPANDAPYGVWAAFRRQEAKKKEEREEKKAREEKEKQEAEMKEAEVKARKEKAKEKKKRKKEEKKMRSRSRSRSPRPGERGEEGEQSFRDRADNRRVSRAWALSVSLRKAKAERTVDSEGDSTMLEASKAADSQKLPEETQEDVEVLRRRFLEQKAAIEKQAEEERTRLTAQFEKEKTRLAAQAEKERIRLVAEEVAKEKTRLTAQAEKERIRLTAEVQKEKDRLELATATAQNGIQWRKAAENKEHTIKELEKALEKVKEETDKANAERDKAKGDLQNLRDDRDTLGHGQAEQDAKAPWQSMITRFLNAFGFGKGEKDGEDEKMGGTGEEKSGPPKRNIQFPVVGFGAAKGHAAGAQSNLGGSQQDPYSQMAGEGGFTPLVGGTALQPKTGSAESGFSDLDQALKPKIEGLESKGLPLRANRTQDYPDEFCGQ